MRGIVRFTSITVILMLFLVMIWSQEAHAYLDPGSGSFILQMLIAALVGGLFVIKVYFQKIKDFFKRLFSKGGSEDGQSHE